MNVKAYKEHARALLKTVGSDGCTASPDGNWHDCCQAHDAAYRTGFVTRREADRQLRLCMQSKGWVVLPWIYWLAVRLFGAKNYKG